MKTQYYLYLERIVGKKTDEGYFFYEEQAWELDEKSVILGCLIDFKDEHSIWDIDEITEEEALRRINDIKKD
ncbi:MAG: hypothetical protein JWM44_4437 [Bacilli bacterium]|nr:hypothetical protein [Bacilli bacterium]